jgi:hypothetical protein
MYVCMYVHVCICRCVYVRMCMYMSMYVGICMHVYTYICRYACMDKNVIYLHFMHIYIYVSTYNICTYVEYLMTLSIQGMADEKLRTELDFAESGKASSKQ